MSAILTTPPTPWQTQAPRLQRVDNALLVLQRVEKVVSVATPSVRNLGASIVDDFAQDLRRLADA